MSQCKTMPLISISIPVYNEADNLDRLYERLSQLATDMAGKCQLEFIFTDNHSIDNTWNKLLILASQDTRVRAIRFSKNFGFQRSILANYMHTQGDAVLQLDADLQDPPEMLAQFFDLWRQGYHVVYGIRQKRQEGYFMSQFRKLGYWFIDKMSGYPIPRNAGDFRLIDRKVIQALEKYRVANPYLRGLIAGLGFKQTGLPYDRDARVAGESKFRLKALLQLGFAGVFNDSVVPLRLATYTGVFLLGLSAMGAIYYLLLKLMHPETPQGMTSIHMLVLFGIGFQSLLLGILGEYLLRIYLVLRAEPVAVVEESINFLHEDLKL
ncbi:MAG: glycosyltransferase family 2 protein [Gammaproteobacteria bacterium]